MLKREIGESGIVAIWVFVAFVFWSLGTIMRNSSYGQQLQQKNSQGRPNNGFLPSSFRAISSYLRIVSSGASTVARSAASVAQSIVDRDGDGNNDQVQWAGFDKLEDGGDVIRQVLLLGYRSGFQVWDVEEADNVRDLVSRHDGPVSFMQMLPKPIASKRSTDKFADSRPILVVCTDGTLSGGSTTQDGLATLYNGSVPNHYDLGNSSFLPTIVRFYSLRTKSYIHVLKFRSIVCSVRCSTRIVAISQAAQIHCFDATTLEREYTILTNPIVSSYPGSGGTGYGPLAVGPRWLAYSGSPVAVSNSGRVVVRDIVSKCVVAQFRAHRSSISALCFDPSGTLLVTASVHGHNINVFKIMPGLLGSSSTGDAGTSYAHLYRLQRGFTNAVIQDISFSDDSNWIMVSSSRGTSHLFAINPFGGSVNFQTSDASYTTKNNGFGVMTKSAVRWPPNLGLLMHNQQSICATGPPVTLSVVSRIRNGNNGWRSTVTGAAAAATGRLGSLSGAIASSFHNSKSNNDLYVDGTTLKTKYHLLVFSPSGCMIQYVLRISMGIDSINVASGLGTAHESVPESDGRLVVEAIQKWNICQKQNRRVQEDNVDIYGENGNSDSNKIYPEGKKNGNSVHREGSGAATKAKISLEEKHHLYISEAELQMHQPHVPVWTKPEIYFQLMMAEGIKMDVETAIRGEIEVERIPIRMIEARSKDLVPVFDYLRHTRIPVLDSNVNGQLHHQRSVLSENGRLSHRSSSGSLDSMTDRGVVAADHQNGVEEAGWNGPRMPVEAMGFVNSSDSPKRDNWLENVNNREHLRTEAQLKFVNSNNGGPKVENHFEDEDDEFD
ncbi:autophagy-related protein 18g isoform X2 [Hevea brasiliensis]|uniref:autophagy-related protein 18g isoform X2 n=1 Tax=Hevea brasiliensis TaxID=3981 RepID=UPI0025E44673|nr:autophagy-related protein 18g isoform X2 [Hevea brasiliensis]